MHTNWFELPRTAGAAGNKWFLARLIPKRAGADRERNPMLVQKKAKGPGFTRVLAAYSAEQGRIGRSPE